MSAHPGKPPKKGRWLAYSLRSFLVVLTIGCLLLGYWVHRAQRQREVVQWVSGTRVTDVTPLAGLTSLRFLDLRETNTTREQIDEL